MINSKFFVAMADSTPSGQRRISVPGDTFTPSLPKKFLGAALGAVVAGFVLTAGQAIAAPPGLTSVPGPLPILGLGAAFGFSRKLRRRIKLHKGTSDISASTGA